MVRGVTVAGQFHAGSQRPLNVTGVEDGRSHNDLQTRSCSNETTGL